MPKSRVNKARKLKIRRKADKARLRMRKRIMKRIREAYYANIRKDDDNG